MDYRKIIAVATCAIILIMLSACSRGAQVEPVVVTKEVSVPVAQNVEPPEELRRLAVPVADLPTFIAPTNPSATSCLSPDGEAKFRLLTGGINSRLEAWEKWGFTQ